MYRHRSAFDVASDAAVILAVLVSAILAIMVLSA
jgi:hypothetical protein